MNYKFILFSLAFRWLYRDFFLRYRVLCYFKDINRNDMRSTCEKILVKHIQVKFGEIQRRRKPMAQGGVGGY